MLFFKTNILSKTKRSIGVFFLLALFLLSTLTPLAFPTPALADPGDTCAEIDPATGACKTTPKVATYADQSPESRATSFWYYNAIGQCMGDVGSWSISNPDDVEAGKWFGWNANGSASGYYMRDTVSGVGDDGKVNCNEGQGDGNSILQNALKFWGINGTQLACGSGMLVRANGTDCTSGNGNFNWKNVASDSKTPILNYIQSKLLSGVSQNSLPKEVSYVYNLGTFLKGCAPGATAQTTKPGGANVYEIKDKTGKTVWYIGTEPGNWGAQYKPNPNIAKNCQDLVNDINTYSIDYQAWLNSHKGVADVAVPTSAACVADPSDPSCSDAPTCTPEGIGWIVCPVMTSIANGVSHIFDVVKSFLVFNSYTTNQTTGLYPAWAIMRNFANIAFVIAFMFIIYSQITSAGIGNYGIKKMLPRLIIGAILVNVSYWICGIAVDLSNILGSSLNDLMITLSKSVVSAGPPVSWGDATASILAGAAVGGVAAVAGIAAAGSIGALLWMLVPIVLAALFAILIAVIILAGRQVLLIIFIVISPLAFVAYLLPNTNKWYKKWQDTFITLLIMFPIIAVIFGGSQFASAIIMSTAGLTMPMVLLALAVQVIPLAITPLVIKFSGGVLGKFAGMVNNPKRGPLDATKNWAKNKQELSTQAGLANANPRKWQIANRLGQRRNNKALSDKARTSTYENQARSAWANSQGGAAASDALAESEMRGQLDKANATSRVANSDAGRALTQQLKSTETQSVIDKAAADAEFVATGDVELQLKAKAAKINADAAQTSQDTLFTAISSKDGAALNPNISDETKIAAQGAARRKLLTDLEGGSATRVLQREQTANLKDINTGYADMAAGIDPQGANRVRATAIATEEAATSEAIKHRVSLLQDGSTADTLIDEAEKALMKANSDGDAISARAAVQVLNSTGSAGTARLHSTIENMEKVGVHSDIVNGVKFDISNAGMKGKDSALDLWAIDQKHSSLSSIDSGTEAITRLNQAELAAQGAKQLDKWRQSGQLSTKQARLVMDAFQKGTIHLDTGKLKTFDLTAADDRRP